MQSIGQRRREQPFEIKTLMYRFSTGCKGPYPFPSRYDSQILLFSKDLLELQQKSTGEVAEFYARTKFKANKLISNY